MSSLHNSGACHKQNTTMIHTCILEQRVSTVQPPLLGGETRELLNVLDTYPGSSWFLMSLSVDGVDGAAHSDGMKTRRRVATHCEHGSLHQRSKCCTPNSSFPHYMVHFISHDQPRSRCTAQAPTEVEVLGLLQLGRCSEQGIP